MDSSDESDDIDIKDDIEVKDCATDKVYVDSDSGEVEFHSDSDSSVDFEEGATETQMKHLTINVSFIFHFNKWDFVFDLDT